MGRNFIKLADLSTVELNVAQRRSSVCLMGAIGNSKIARLIQELALQYGA